MSHLPKIKPHRLIIRDKVVCFWLRPPFPLSPWKAILIFTPLCRAGPVWSHPGDHDCWPWVPGSPRGPVWSHSRGSPRGWLELRSRFLTFTSAEFLTSVGSEFSKFRNIVLVISPGIFFHPAPSLGDSNDSCGTKCITCLKSPCSLGGSYFSPSFPSLYFILLCSIVVSPIFSEVSILK